MGSNTDRRVHMGSNTDRRDFIKYASAVGTIIGIAGCAGDDNDGLSGPAPEDDIEYEPLGELEWAVLSREDNEPRYEATQLVIDDLEEIGFEIADEDYEFDTWVNRLFDREWDLHMQGWNGTVERLFPYYNLYYSFHSNYAEVGEGNYSNFSREEYDETIESFVQSMDQEERTGYAHEAQEILGENVPVIPTVHPNSLAAANTDLFTGWDEMPGDNSYWNVNSLTNLEPVDNEDTVIYGTTQGLGSYPNFFDLDDPYALATHIMYYDPLVRIDLDGEPYPAAAEDWEHIDDTTIDVELRENLSWHDGEDVTAEDVKFTWDTIRDNMIAYLDSDIDPYESSELNGTHSIRFNLSHPFSGFISSSLYRVPILPEHIWGDITEDESLEHPAEWNDPDMVGSGPFQFVEYDPGNQVIMEVFEDHYLYDDIEFENLVYNIYGTSSTIIGDLGNNHVTFSQNLSYEHWRQASEEDNIEAISNPSHGTQGFWVQTDQEPFNDVLVRQALAHAVNRNGIIDLIYQGEAEPAAGPISPLIEPYHNENVPTYEYDPEAAIDLLAESGFRWDENVIVKPVDWEPQTEYISS